MDTSRDDVGISIRSAFLRKGTQQRFSLFALTIISILLIFLETIDTKPLNVIRSFIKDFVYRSAVVATYPTKIFSGTYNSIENHFVIYKNYEELKKENEELKSKTSESDFVFKCLKSFLYNSSDKSDALTKFPLWAKTNPKGELT